MNELMFFRLINRIFYKNKTLFAISDNSWLAIIFIVLFIILILGNIIFCYLYISNRKKSKVLKDELASKLDFFARMSHEIRTPLAAIIGINSIAKEEIDDKERIEQWISKISISSNHMLDIINDILDLEKINNGKLDLRIKKFSLHELVDMIKAIYADAIVSKGLSFNLDMDKNISQYLMGDDLRLRQVIMNLVSNAIKYNRNDGYIYLKVNLLRDESDFQTIKFSVSDSGIGISSKYIENVFNAYEREKREETDGIYGSGLGLNIANKMVMLMGGKISLQSEYGKGSTFSFEIDIKKVVEENEENVKDIEIDLTSRNILVAEDNDINAIIMKNILTRLGANTTIATDGKIAVETYEKSNNNYYDVILMDIKMPLMSGYEATKAIRNLNRKDSKDVKIIALSAGGFSDDIKKSLESGMDAHLVKPLNISELQIALKKVLNL